MNKKLLAVILACFICAALLTGCKKDPPETPEEPLPTSEQTPAPAPMPAPAPVPEPAPPESPIPAPSTNNSTQLTRTEGRIILATATSAVDSGLLAYILPTFTAETGWGVDIASVGAGAALQMGRDGDADVLLVNSRPDEDKFIADGCGDKRYDVMYNDYVVVGPDNGFLSQGDDIEATFKTIIESFLGFVSRGDDSGAHKKEMSIWGALGINPEGNPLYLSIGQGMAVTLGITKELNIHTLVDRATWLKFADKGDLTIICEGHADLLNHYSVIPVSASVSEDVNAEGGQAFADWITGPSGQGLIAQYGVGEFSQPLFTPAA